MDLLEILNEVKLQETVAKEKEELENIEVRKTVLISLNKISLTSEAISSLMNNYGLSLMKEQVNVDALKSNVRKDALNLLKKLIDDINNI